MEFDLSYIIWDVVSFSFGRKIKHDLSHEIHGNVIFSVYMDKLYKYDITLLQKKSKMIFSRKKYT